jgi:hypothetical protein
MFSSHIKLIEEELLESAVQSRQTAKSTAVSEVKALHSMRKLK